MQESLGSPEKYKEAFQEKLKEVCASGEDLKLKDLKEASTENSRKTGDETVFTGSNAIEQKQEGLYALAWHPIGGMPDPAVFCELADAMEEIEGVELRLAPYETAYIINLTGAEAERLNTIIQKDMAQSLFETSVSCIGASVCQAVSYTHLDVYKRQQ